MLAANNTLTSLNLGWNYLRNESAVAVADSLRKNHSLTTLGLAYNSFSDFATQVVIRLPHHPLSYQCGFSGALIPLKFVPVETNLMFHRCSFAVSDS